ncbi:MAG: hypothetical protein COB02_12610 [Candidatus Cloacimonadota bacterium]|nr:MAG: hypothetical protein COB02_12610 [Candidatus Cloacimonadota bacterium]
MRLLKDKKALSLIEVLVSSMILSIVLATYSSSTQGKQKILMQMKNLGIYQQLAYSQLEKVMTFIGSQERRDTTFASKSALVANADKNTRFMEFTRLFSQEGQSSGLDSDNGLNTVPRIDLLQAEVYGLGTEADYESVTADVDRDKVFLSLPYPNELGAGYNIGPDVISDAISTFHNITSLIKDSSFRDVYPLVSEEYLTVVAGQSLDRSLDNRYDQIGFDDNNLQNAADVSLSTGLELFINKVAISSSSDGNGSNSWNNELIRRYVYYRKVREGNLVFSNAVRGRVDVKNLDTTDRRADKFSKLISTDVDLLYIQHLNDWTSANGSSNNGNMMSVEGTAFTTEIGGVGTHSIMVMIVVRECNRSYADGLTAIADAEFIDNSKIKAVAQGIVSPSYGKNLLWTLDLSYHRYQWSRIPGIRQRLLQSETGDSM